MIVSENKHWWPLNLYFATLQQPPAAYIATTRIVQDVMFHAKKLPSWSWDEWGYGNNKLRQLERNYINEDEFARVKAILARRSLGKYTAVALNLRGAAKSARSQGWCMLSVVITRTEDHTDIEVQYRTTEVILKFAADVIFLRDYILPNLINQLTPIRSYTFRFANCWIGGPYLAYLIDKKDTLAAVLEAIYKEDLEFFHRMTRPLLKSLLRQNQFHPFSPARVGHEYLWDHSTEKQRDPVKDWLLHYFKEHGVKIPRDFHDEATYVPRGKRSEVENDDEE